MLLQDTFVPIHTILTLLVLAAFVGVPFMRARLPRTSFALRFVWAIIFAAILAVFHTLTVLTGLMPFPHVTEMLNDFCTTAWRSLRTWLEHGEPSEANGGRPPRGGRHRR